MKKICSCIFLTIGLLLLLVGCGECKHEWREDGKVCTLCGLDERTIDEKFLESLATGLQNRWILNDADDGKESIAKADWENYFNAEYDQIASYQYEEFEDKELEKWAKQYIDSIVKSKEALAYYGTNQWGAKYNNGVYHRRTEALYNIHKIKAVPVSVDNQVNLMNLLSDGEVSIFTSKLFETVEFKKVEDEYGWRTYEVILTNETSLTFDYFSLDIDLLDKDGVTLETEIASVENWQPGEKARFRFSTDEKPNVLEVESAGWNF